MVKGFYNIYINERQLQLVNTSDMPFVILQDKTQTSVEYKNDTAILLQSIRDLEKGKYDRLVVYADDVERLFKDFKKLFICIEACGGVVVNNRDEVLAIFRRKHWDFPKGKMEPGESKRQTAIREVKEECGLKNVEIVRKLGATYHTFGTADKRKLKVSYWYIMESSDKKLVPQKDEDIEIAKWMSVKDFLAKAKPIYRNIVDVFEAYLIKASVKKS